MTILDAAPATAALQHKSLGVAGFKIVDDAQGIVECFVSGIGNKDSVGDIIQPGAFVDSLKKRTPKGVWGHDWSIWVSKTLDIREVPAGDPSLPEKMKAAGIGGLYVKTQFNLDTQRGSEAYSDVKFFGEESEWSIGYMTTEERYSKDLQANLLIKIDLYEYSPVLFGANPLTATVGVKVAVDDKDHITVEVIGVKDDELATKVAGAVEAVMSGLKEADKGAAGTGGDVEPEGTEHKVVPGSMEARYRAISQALGEKYPKAYAYPVATFTDSVVYEVYSYSDDTEEGTFQCSYSITDDVVTLGDPQPVDVVEVIVAKTALAQAEAKGVKVDELALTQLGAALDLMDKTNLFVELQEQKAGRVLSSKNLDRLNQVKSLVDEILSSADANESSEEEKARIADLMEKYANDVITVEEFKAAMAEVESKTDDAEGKADAHQYEQGDDGTCKVCNMKEDDPNAKHTGDARSGGSETAAEGDAAKGTATDEEKEKAATIVLHATKTSDVEWDGPAQKKNLSDEASALREAFAWVDPNTDGSEKSQYKFLHHLVGEDGATGDASTAACKTAIDILNGGRGGTQIPADDKRGVYDHLAKHLLDAGQEVPPLNTVDAEGKDAVHTFTDAEAIPEPPTAAKSHDFESDGAALCDVCDKGADHWIHAKTHVLPTVEKLSPALVALQERADDLGEKAEDIVRVSGEIDQKLTEVASKDDEADVNTLVEEIDAAVDDLMELLGIADDDTGEEKAEMVVLSPLDILSLELALTDEALAS